MRAFDLFTKLGWSSWWRQKGSLWAYRYVLHDTGKHAVCLVKGHIDLPNYTGGRTCCRRCYIDLKRETL